MKIINIAKEFTDAPGPRHKSDGPYSGEEFRCTILEPKYLECIKNNEKILVDFDGGYGYLISFLEEAFGGLSRKYGAQSVLKTFEFKSTEEEALIEKVKSYIINANNKK